MFWWEQGTKLVFYDSHSDVLLLEIPNSIPDKYGAYKIGFDAAAETPNRAVAIHHPAGNIKRISYANTSYVTPPNAIHTQVMSLLDSAHGFVTIRPQGFRTSSA